MNQINWGKLSGFYNQDQETYKEWMMKKITRLTHQWNVYVKYSYPSIANIVLKGIDQNGMSVILKIGNDSYESVQERWILTHSETKKYPRVLHCLEEENAYIMEAIEPGYSLKDIDKDEEETSKIVAELLIEHWKISAEKAPLIEIRKRINALFIESSIKSPFVNEQEEMIQQARHIALELLESNNDRYVLHGDLHHENILYSQSSNWCMIDPKGVIGPREYDFATYLINQVDEKNFTTQLTKRIKGIQLVIDLDPILLIKWAFVQSVLSICWKLEDHMEVLTLDWSRGLLFMEVIDLKEWEELR